MAWVLAARSTLARISCAGGVQTKGLAAWLLAASRTMAWVLAGALDFGEDILCRSCPDKGLGRLVARFQVLVDTEVQLGRKVLNNNDRARLRPVFERIS